MTRQSIRCRYRVGIDYCIWHIMRMLPALLFISLAMTVVGGAHHYAWARLFRDTGLAQPWPTVGRWLFLALWLSMPLSFILYRFLPGGREAMRLFLVELIAEYGSVRGYARDRLGADDELVTALHRQLLTG